MIAIARKMETEMSRDSVSTLPDTRLTAAVRRAPWVLRITEHKDKPSPLYVVKERIARVKTMEGGDIEVRVLHERGLLFGATLRRCMPAIRKVADAVQDEAGIALNIPSYLGAPGLSFRGNLPLNSSAGTKIALLCKLAERIKNLDRVELMAWRIVRFTNEEALYWLTRATESGPAGSRWALAGMRIMLGGPPGDKDIADMLSQARLL